MKLSLFVLIVLLVATESVQAGPVTIFQDCKNTTGWTIDTTGSICTLNFVQDPTYGGHYLDATVYSTMGNNGVVGFYIPLGDANIPAGKTPGELTDVNLYMQFDVKIIDGNGTPYYAAFSGIFNGDTDDSPNFVMAGTKFSSYRIMAVTDNGPVGRTAASNLTLGGNAQRLKIHIYYIAGQIVMDVDEYGIDAATYAITLYDSDTVVLLDAGESLTEPLAYFGISDIPNSTYKWSRLYVDNLYFSNVGPYTGTALPGWIASEQAYPVVTQADLENINNYLSGNYVLMNDIDLAGTTYTHSVIASGNTVFTGTFEGSGFVIRNLTVNSSDSNVGLFGKIGNGSSISNLGIGNAVVGGNENVGVLAGTALFGSSVSNCYSTGAVSGTGNNIGGLLGNTACVITQSFSTASVNGVDYAGGLAGYNLAPDFISQTYSVGAVSGTGVNVGGLIGYSSVLSRASVSFDGDTDHIALSRPLPIFNSSFTIEMWIYFNDDGRGILLGDFGLTGCLNTNFERSTEGKLRIYWNNGSLNYYTDADVVGTQKWQHITIQRDKTANVFKVFIDGKLVNSFTGVGTDVVATVPHYLGRDSRTGDTAFNGMMSDVRIWNYVRTQSQIQSDMYQQLTGSESGLVGYWKLDEGSGWLANDSSPSNNDGYRPLTFPPIVPDLAISDNNGIVNGATFVSVPTKYFNYAMNFNGNSDYIALSNPLPIFNGSFTIEMWVYFNDTGRDVLLGDYNLTSSIQTNFEKYTDGKLRIFWNNGNPSYITAANVVTINTWHHIAFQRDKTADVFRVYVDGNLVGTSTTAGSDKVATIPHYLGRDFRTGTTALNGMMGDVRIWNYVRTQSEIQTDMNHLLVGNETGLIDNWQFNPTDSVLDLTWDTTSLMADSFWDKDTSNQNNSSGGIGKTTVQMQDANTFVSAGWDFNDVWLMLTDGYPILLWQSRLSDLDNNGVVDFHDLALLASDWLKKSQDLPEYPDISITNPYENVNWSTFGQYKANMHTHTNQSDGADDPATVIDVYNSHGYDILAITDHDDPTGPPTWPWTDYGRDPAAIGMTAIKGNEVSRGHHTLSYFCDYGDTNQTLTENAIIEIGNQDGLAVMAHPVYINHYLGTRGLPSGMIWTAQVYADFFNQYDHLLGMEVYNRITNGDAHRDVWDDILTLTMPERQVFGFSNDDSHSSSHRGYGYEMFLLSEANEQTVRNSMEAGGFYFGYSLMQWGSGPVINSINVNSSLGTITISASGYDEITWISRGVEVGTGTVFTVGTESSSQGYVRAEITGPGGVAFTQPFGIMNPCTYVNEEGLNYPGDMNKDCAVDVYDLEIFADQWLEQVWQ